MGRINWFMLGSLAANVVLIFLLFRGCGPVAPCPEGVITKVRVDTIRVKPEEVKPVITVSVPKPKSIIPYKESHLGATKALIAGSVGLEPDAAISSPIEGQDDISCLDTVLYIDEDTKTDQYKVIVRELVTGNRIISRETQWFNLQPRIVEHIEKIRPERVKLYAGAFAGFARPYNGDQWNWSVGPALQLSIPQGVAIGYGFDAKNNGHLVNVLYKIKLKK